MVKHKDVPAFLYQSVSNFPYLAKVVDSSVKIRAIPMLMKD